MLIYELDKTHTNFDIERDALKWKPQQNNITTTGLSESL